uniref:Epididymal peptidase inhibitor n=1 Tax=Jaculus jaculus TaxID=51337 RepID=A0A8C5P0U6_JACJA
MKLSGLLRILVLFVFFGYVQGSVIDWFFPRRCPRIREQCEFKERNVCLKDRQCPKNERCCIFSCGKKCMDLTKDVCSLPKETGLCLAYFPRWWYSKENNTCYKFIYGGCRGNNNNFQTKAMCENTCYKSRGSS